MTTISKTDLADQLAGKGDDAMIRVIVGSETDPAREAGNAFINDAGYLMVAYECGNTTRLYEAEVELAD